jgi:hypothetical protein
MIACFISDCNHLATLEIKTMFLENGKHSGLERFTVEQVHGGVAAKGGNMELVDIAVHAVWFGILIGLMCLAMAVAEMGDR